jgi:hypothetical protein
MRSKTNQLEETGNANPFKVPEGYFENLSDRILTQLPEKVEEETKSLNLWERVQPWVYMAAMFVGIALMVRIFIGSPPNLDLTSSTDIDEFYQYYEEQFANKVYHEAFYLNEVTLSEDYYYY